MLLIWVKYFVYELRKKRFLDTIFSSYLYVYGMCSEAFDFDPVKAQVQPDFDFFRPKVQSKQVGSQSHELW